MKIVVLAGGISTEREVSIVSGTMVFRAHRERGHQAILLDVFFGKRKRNISVPLTDRRKRPGKKREISSDQT